MRALGVVGWSGSGKTTLLVQLIPLLTSRNLEVSTLKHAHHGFDVDREGKDSYRHRQAGAREVMIGSARRWALLRELGGDEKEPDLDALLARMSPVDLVLFEGFRHEARPKLEIHRPSLGLELLAANDPHVIAVASDAPMHGLTVPVLDLNDPGTIADFILHRLAVPDINK